MIKAGYPPAMQLWQDGSSVAVVDNLSDVIDNESYRY